jgi:PPOX class probable FMN-dependent enzyme
VDLFERALRSEAELRAIYDPPSGLAAVKEIDHLDEQCERFIAAASLLFVATHAADGRCDVTPRGGPPGFVTVLDRTMLAIPDATGNRRIDTLRNIVETGRIGIVFLIPGESWTLRVNGRACVTDDAGLRESLSAVGKPPRTAIVVEAEEVFTHCPKAFVRSRAWQPDAWLAEHERPSAAEVLHAHVADPAVSLADVETSQRESLLRRLE